MVGPVGGPDCLSASMLPLDRPLLTEAAETHSETIRDVLQGQRLPTVISHKIRFLSTQAPALVDLNSVVDRPSRACEQLISKYYHLMFEAFRCKDEIGSIENLVASLTSSKSSLSIMAVIGHEIVGGLNGFVFEAIGKRWTVIEQIFVDSKYRSSNFRLGQRLYDRFFLESALKGAAGIIAEVHDPRLATAKRLESRGESLESCTQRVAWWKKRGHLAFDAPYFQPPLDSDCKKLIDLILTVRPIGSANLMFTSDQYLALVKGMYDEYIECDPMQRESCLQRLQRWFTENQGVPLIDPLQPRQWVESLRIT